MNSANFHQSKLMLQGGDLSLYAGYKWLCAFALILIMQSPARAYIDPLDTPAPMKGGAQYSLFLDIAKAGERLVAVGERGHILLSDDQGRSWQQAQVPSQLQLNAVYFVDAAHGWAVGEDAVILNTTDGGDSWTRQFDDRHADIMGPLLDVYFSDTLQGFAVGVFGKFFSTTDGGKSWHQDNERLDNIDEWHLHAITASDNAVYIVGEAGIAFRSLDQGQTWSSLDTQHEGSFFGVAARSTGSADEIIAFGVGGRLKASSNNGEQWRYLESKTKSGLASATWLDDNTFLIVGADGVLVKGSTSTTLKTTHLESRLPLSSAVTVGDDWVLVGIGGPHRVVSSDLFDDSSAHSQEDQ